MCVCVYDEPNIAIKNLFFYFFNASEMVVSKDLRGKLVKPNSLTIISLYISHILYII